MKSHSKLQQALLMLVFFILTNTISFSQIDDRVVLGYFPTWSESWTSQNQNSKLREIPNFVNYVFLSFAKPNLTYIKGTYEISETGIQVPYDGCTLKESISALKDKGISVILSIGGETYWGTNDAYTINYQQIKDLVDDLGFVGIDWDFEPNGSFADIGSEENVQHFIDFFNNSRALMPKNEGYILACAPSGVGALGGQTNNDMTSPYAFENRNTLTGENDTNLYNGTVQTNGINLFGFSATGHMIPVIESVGDKIDLIAFQGYNAGGSTNRSIMYDAFAYYAEQYDFTVAAGIHYPDEPWGPYYEYTHQNVASLSNHIQEHPYRNDNKDGIMIWQLLLEETNRSAYSYLHVSNQVFNGKTESVAIQNANNFSLMPYNGGSEGCNDGGGDSTFCNILAYNPSIDYPTPGTQVFYECKIWSNQWYANANEIPGSNSVWIEISTCNESEECDSLSINEFDPDKNIILFPNPANKFIQVSGMEQLQSYRIYTIQGTKIKEGKLNKIFKINIEHLAKGIYFFNIDSKKSVPFIKY